MMRWTQTLVPTLRDDPQEAEIASHKLMVRAGLIRKVTGGIYTFLPLGLRALRNVERIIREEMDRAGALEVSMPALQPRELWDRSGRYDVLGQLMYHVRDRQKREMVLGPTHEEVITELVAREIRSYREVPKTFYQIQTKFRDEIRPRFGLMRAREFIMKDAYSFDMSMEAADTSYQAMYDAYSRIFERCGLTTKVVEADTGAMGGKWSHEFMVPSDTGEDSMVECDSCSYAANLERAELAPEDPAQEPSAGTGAGPEEVSTPGMKTIEQVSAFLDCEPRKLVKTLIYTGSAGTVAALVPGDRDLNEAKLARALERSDLELADDETIQQVTGAAVGFAGPVGLGIPVYADASLEGITGAVTGANKTDAHLVNVDLARDASVAGFHDLRLVVEADPCPRCEGVLHVRRGIEVGHVFKLGTKYSDSFQATCLDEKGDSVPLVMGCYGIGVTRTLQAVIEQCHDDAGIAWPTGVAPYKVLVLALTPEHPESVHVAEALSEGLESRGISVLLDDRDERPGVKFKDADLVGIPVRVVCSERSLTGGNVEIKLRTERDKEMVPVGEAAEAITRLCAVP